MTVVLDTNIVLDLWVFRDPRVGELDAAIANQAVTWLATPAMREELAAVLSYEQIGARMERANVSGDAVLQAFDRHAKLVDPPAASALKCRDPDDQKFVDLALARGATLLSKDRALLALRRKLRVASAFSAPPPARSGPGGPSASTA